jgi:hypothetical protein
MPELNVTGTFTIVSDDVVGFAPERNAPAGVPRNDGAICRRVYMESRTSQARRIHYWKLRDGRIEFSRVALHDDFTP